MFEKDYAPKCRAGIQPYMITKEQFEKFKSERPGSFGYNKAVLGKEGGEPIGDINPDNIDELRRAYGSLTNEEEMNRFAIPFKGAYFICPKYWSMSEDIPLYPAEIKGKETEDAYKPRDPIDSNRGKDVRVLYDEQTKAAAGRRYDSTMIYFPGYMQKDTKRRPCCFLVPNNLKKIKTTMDKYQTNPDEPDAPGNIIKSKPIISKKPSVSITTSAIASASADFASAIKEPLTEESKDDEYEIIQEEMGTLEKPTKGKRLMVFTDTKWDSNKATYLLPDTDVLELMNLTGFVGRCEIMLKKHIQDLTTACLVRKPSKEDYHTSLFRSIISLQMFSRLSHFMENEADNFDEGEDVLNKFTNNLVKFVTAEIFRNVQGGALMRLFLPKTDEEIATLLVKYGDIVFLKKWLKENKESINRGLYRKFKEEIESEIPSDLLIRWAVSHEQFKEYTMNKKEPKILSVYWEILTLYPWLNIAEEDSLGFLNRGINLFIIETSNHPYLVCPGEGPLERYYDERRPTGILLRKEGLYQPLILLTREDILEKGRKRATSIFKTSGILSPNISSLITDNPKISSLLENLWESIKHLPEQSKRQCSPESLPPYENTPTIEEIVRVIKEIGGLQFSGLTIDELGRITGVNYNIKRGANGSSISVAPLEKGETILYFPVQPTGIIAHTIETKIYKMPFENKIGYIEAIDIISRLVNILEETLKSETNIENEVRNPYRIIYEYLKEITPVLEKVEGGYYIRGLKLNSGLIVPVGDEEIIKSEILKDMYGINIKEAVITNWGDEIDNLLTMSISHPEKYTNMIEELIKEYVIIISKNDSLIEKIVSIRNNNQLLRYNRINEIRKVIGEIEEIFRDTILKDSGSPEEYMEIILNRVALIYDNEILVRQILNNKDRIMPRFPVTKKKDEIQLSFGDIDGLRATDLYYINSNYIEGDEIFAIGGAIDSNYIPKSTARMPIPIKNLWNERLSFKSNTASAIDSRGGIINIRMIPFGSTIKDSWDAIAYSMRDAIAEPSFDGDSLRILMVKEWENFFEKNGIRGGTTKWNKMMQVLIKEKNLPGEDIDKSPELFIQDIISGRIMPSMIDFYLIHKSALIPYNHAFVFLYGYSVGEVKAASRYPVMVLGGNTEGWSTYKYSLLLRIPNREETIYYSYMPIIGVRKQGRQNSYSLDIQRSQIPSGFIEELERCSKIGVPPAWIDTGSSDWIKLFIKDQSST
jgi:uncharacterized protein YecA (UPF0149 family)